MSIRINQSNSLAIDTHRPGSPNPKAPSFSQELIRVETDNQIELESLVGKVNQAGEQLTKSMTLQHLQDYKTALKNLLNKVAKSHGLNTEHIWNRQGQSRILTAIRQIEKHLADLTDEITAHNATQINILTKIDEIKGMIVDLFT